MTCVAAIIIAAGSSSRLGEPKQLIELNGETLLARAIRLAREARCEPVVVVLGAFRQRIESQVDLSAARIVFNSDWEEGMASSIRAGISALGERQPESAGVLLMVCDQPTVSSEHLIRMLDPFRQDPTRAVASVYMGKRGIPAVFPAAAFADLLALHGDEGARRLLSREKTKVIEVPLPGGELDIDRPEDLPHLQS